MIATPLPPPLPIIINPTARLQIKYVSRLPPPASKLRHRSPTLSNLSATVIETSSPSSKPQSPSHIDSWTISTTITNTNAPVPNTNASERHAISITFWPMFDPDCPRHVTSAITGPILPGRSTTLDFTVPFRDVAVVDKRVSTTAMATSGNGGDGRDGNWKGKRVLEEGIYMFGIRSEKVGTGGGAAAAARGKDGTAAGNESGRNGNGNGNGNVNEIIKQVCVVGRKEWDI